MSQQDATREVSRVLARPMSACAQHHRYRAPSEQEGYRRGLIGTQVVVRRTTLDPDYDNDILVMQWPQGVAEARKPVRYTGSGRFRACICAMGSGCFFVIGYAGVMFTPVLLYEVLVQGVTSNMMVPLAR